MKQLSFSNFRRFEYFPPLAFGDITFLVGGNNCGKSTLVKALLLTLSLLASPLKAMRMTRTIVMRRFLLLYFSPSTMQKASLLLLITRNLRQLCAQMVQV